MLADRPWQILSRSLEIPQSRRSVGAAPRGVTRCPISGVTTGSDDGSRAGRPLSGEPVVLAEDRAGGGARGAADGTRLRVVEAGATVGYSDRDELYRDNVVRVYRLLYGKVGNRPDAEDLTTEVFLAVWGPLRLDVSRAEVRAYLGATARTVLAAFWRKRAGVAVTSIDLHDVAQCLDDQPGDNRSREPLRLMLDGLPERYRRVLELRFYEACSVKETARRLGVSVANAKVLQHRALRMASTAMKGFTP